MTSKTLTLILAYLFALALPVGIFFAVMRFAGWRLEARLLRLLPLSWDEREN